MNKLVYLKKNDAFTNSLVISDGTGVDHRKIKEVIRKRKTEFEKLGAFSASYQVEKAKRGRRQTYYELNEPQATFLITLLKNTDIVVSFKLKLVEDFYKTRKLLAEKSTQTWVKTREQGKLTRRAETDKIKEFIEYAVSQGSNNAQWYYVEFSRFANKIAGVKNRDIASVKQLNMLELAEDIIIKEVSIGLHKELPYKQIYKNCKNRLDKFSDTALLDFNPRDLIETA